jgi:chromo domain-containing protein 1
MAALGKPRTGLLRGKPSCEHSETELDMQLTLHNETLIRSNVYHIPFQEVAKDQPNAMSPPLSNDESTAELLSCTDFKNDIEDACKLNFTEIFSFNFDDMSETISDRRAFLLFHPEHHMEELELITRWLLMHHVDVYNFWYDDAWEQFQEQIAQGGTGAIMAHPDFECWSDVPGLGEILKAKVRLWSVGFQKESAFDPQISTFAPTMQYECIEIFPHGGIIYITDDVFRKKPAEALKIFELFLAKIEKCRQVAGPIDPFKRVDDGCLLWRIGVRPELMQALYERVERHEADIEEGNPQFVSLLKLYELFEETKYIERDIVGPLTLQPDDYFPIISERHSTMEDYYYPALATSQSLANTKMIEYFSGMLIDQRQYYRQFFVIHTEPDGNDAKEWKEKVQNIDEVMSAEQFIDEFEKEPRGNRFDFYEWAFPPKPRADSVADAMVTT